MKNRGAVVLGVLTIALVCSLPARRGECEDVHMAQLPFRISTPDSLAELTNQLNRVFRRVEQALNDVAKSSSASVAPAADPTTSAALASVRAEVAQIQGLLRPMAVQGGSVVGGSILTNQLGISAATGAPVWAPSTAILADQQIRPTGAAADGTYYFRAQGNGTTGATEPLWNPEDGAVTPDGTVSGGWLQSGLAADTPIGTSSFSNIPISALSMTDSTWVDLGSAALYMGDINGPVFVSFNISDSTFSAPEFVDVDIAITFPIVGGSTTTYEIAQRAYFSSTRYSAKSSGNVSFITTINSDLGAGIVRVSGSVTIAVSGYQATGSTQTISVGALYLACLHS